MSASKLGKYSIVKKEEREASEEEGEWWFGSKQWLLCVGLGGEKLGLESAELQLAMLTLYKIFNELNQNTTHCLDSSGLIIFLIIFVANVIVA